MSTPDNEKRMTEKDTLLSREEAAQKLNGAGVKIEVVCIPIPNVFTYFEVLKHRNKHNFDQI